MKLRMKSHKPKRDRPGLALERKFKYYVDDLYRHGHIAGWVWPSQYTKSAFDFIITKKTSDILPMSLVYIDVVGQYETEYLGTSQTKLITGHKNYREKLLARNYCVYGKNLDKIQWGGEAWLAFLKEELYFEYCGEITHTTWSFLRITENLPKGDITLTNSRKHGIRTENTVFGEPIKSRRAVVNASIEQKEDDFYYGCFN